MVPENDKYNKSNILNSNTAKQVINAIKKVNFNLPRGRKVFHLRANI